jgi:hypothetical protein
MVLGMIRSLNIEGIGDEDEVLVSITLDQPLTFSAARDILENRIHSASAGATIRFVEEDAASFVLTLPDRNGLRIVLDKLWTKGTPGIVTAAIEAQDVEAAAVHTKVMEAQAAVDGWIRDNN